MSSCKIQKKYWDNISHSNSCFRSSRMINKHLSVSSFPLFKIRPQPAQSAGQKSTKTFTKKNVITMDLFF